MQNRATHGVLPMENSIGGTIHRNYDLLVDNEIAITGEVELDVVHCLQALPGTKLEDVTTVYSHPQALAQCERYLKELGATVEAVYDTAGGAKLVAEQRLTGAAALASRRAAEVFGLEVIQEAVQDFEFNITRFFVVGGAVPTDAEQDDDRLRAAQHPGVALQGAQRLRASRHQSQQAREPSDAGASLGVPVLRGHRCPARRAPLGPRPHPTGRVREMEPRVLGTYKGWDTGETRSRLKAPPPDVTATRHRRCPTTVGAGQGAGVCTGSGTGNGAGGADSPGASSPTSGFSSAGSCDERIVNDLRPLQLIKDRKVFAPGRQWPFRREPADSTCPMRSRMIR